MNRHGFTLIEVLASILLIGGALVAIMTIVPQMIENSLGTERLTKVIFLAERKTEEVIGKVINNFDNDGAGYDESATAFTDDGYSAYKYTIDDEVISAEDDDSKLKKIQVQVWHDEDDGNTVDSNEESITLDTKLADRS